MKKILLGAGMLLLMVGCSGKGNSEKERKDSIRMADSLAQVEAALLAQKAEQAAMDQARQDSIMYAQIDEEYKNGLILNAGKKIYTYIGDCTVAGQFSMNCELLNNSSITWNENDYSIIYRYGDLDTIDGDLVPVKKTKTQKSRTLSPEEDYTFQLKIIGDDLFSPSLKIKLSKSDFTERFKNETIFDKTKDKFVPKNTVLPD